MHTYLSNTPANSIQPQRVHHDNKTRSALLIGRGDLIIVAWQVYEVQQGEKKNNRGVNLTAPKTRQVSE